VRSQDHALTRITTTMNSIRPTSRLVRPSSFAPLAGAALSDLFENIFGSNAARGASNAPAFVPHLEWTDRGADYLLRAELPGLDVENVSLSFDDDVLVLSGEKKSEERTENDRVVASERTFGCFERSVRVPGPVDASAIKAAMKNGVLEVVLPKACAKDGARRIEISR
jgi:HSP20 family protein